MNKSTVVFDRTSKNYSRSRLPKQGYWYMWVIRECVLCGRGNSYKYRVYDRPKPTDPRDRYERIEYACNGHFL